MELCNKCGIEKPKSDFYTKKNGALCHPCRKCVLAKQAEYREKNRYKIRATQRLRIQNNREEYYKAQRERDHQNRHKSRARLLARRHIPVQPCIACGKPGERHHPDYNHPLAVVFLCRSHHKQIHDVVTHQTDLDPKIVQMVNEKFWELI